MIVDAAIKHVETIDKVIKDSLVGTGIENLNEDVKNIFIQQFKADWKDTKVEEYIK